MKKGIQTDLLEEVVAEKSQKDDQSKPNNLNDPSQWVELLIK